MARLQRKVSTKWSPELAYAVGLILSDGCLSQDGRHITFSSKDRDLIEVFKGALCLKNTIYFYPDYRGNRKGQYSVTFGDKVFYAFLYEVGLSTRKSLTLHKIKVPRKHFNHFLRGVFDGDGTFYTFWDKRWKTSFCYQVSIASASEDFIQWLQQQLSMLYGTKGFIHKGKGVWDIRYVKGDSKVLFDVMYKDDQGLCLKRKKDKMTNAFVYDGTLH